MSKIKVEVTSEANVRKGTNSNGDYEIITQICYLHKDGQKYPDKFLLNLEGVNKQYGLGMYDFDLVESLETGQYDRLGFVRFPVLVSVSK